jgi:protocatechuate 3,4-dioxygenase beta subunit
VEDHEQDINDLGLAADLQMMKRSPIDRRRLLKLGAAGIGLLLAGGATAAATVAAQSGGGAAIFLPLLTNTATATATVAPTPVACVSEIPQETAGPYPADGSNASNQSLNVLSRSGIVRSDIRSSLGTGNIAAGVPLTIELTLVDSNSNCAPLAGYAIYIWHCDRDGNYSLYSSGVTNEDYLRGVQATDSNGKVSFTSIFPACYSGRWPHVHFEIYPSLAQATGPSNLVHTSQLAIPQAVCDTVYATSGYEASVRNLAQVSLASDNVFRDGYSSQLATMSGDVTSGYTAQLTVGVDM